MIKDKIVVITGAGGLLGKEFVKTVSEFGGISVAVDSKEGFINDAEIIYNNNCINLYMDITSAESIDNVIGFIDKKFGRIDALVNAAYPRNKNYGRDFFEVQYFDFCENVNLHLGGFFLTSQKFASYFKKCGRGNIIFLASIYGVIPPRFQIYNETQMVNPVEYGIIKSSIIYYTKYLAKYLKGLNIRVNSISPGGILNEQPENFIREYKSFCLNKGMLDKSDINGTLLFLLSDHSKYINGQNIIVDDGFTL